MKYIKHLLLLLLVVTLVGCKEEPFIEKLSTPENVRFEDMVRWDEVENATEYHVLIGNDSYITSNNYYIISDQGEYSVQVIAVASGYEDSEASTTLELSLIYENIITPNIQLVEDKIEWDLIDDAVSYNLFINGEKTETTNNYSNVMGSGAFEISIQAVYPIGVSNVSESVIIENDLTLTPTLQFQYSQYSTDDVKLYISTPAENVFVQDSDGEYINSTTILTEVNGELAIKSSYISNQPIGTLEFSIINLDEKIPVEITISDRQTPYIISSTLINTDGQEDIVLQFEEFEGEVSSVNGTAQDTVPWSSDNGFVTIDKEFVALKFGLSSNSPAEFSLSYVISVDGDSVIGYLYFTELITE